MPKDEEDDTKIKKEPSDSSKKAAKVAAKGAAAYYGGKKALDTYNAAEDKPVTGGLVDSVEKGIANNIDKNIVAKNVGKVADKVGALDAADKALGGKSGSTPGSKGSGSEVVSPINKSGNYNSNNFSNSSDTGDSSKDSKNKDDTDGNNNADSQDDPSDNLGTKKKKKKSSSTPSGDGDVNLDDVNIDVVGSVKKAVLAFSLISIICIPIIIILFVNLAEQAVKDKFSDILGYFELKDGSSLVGGSYESSNKDAMEFYQRFVDLEIQYDVSGNYGNINGELVMAGISIITRNSNDFTYTDFDDEFIEEFFEAGISDGKFSDTTFKENLFPLIRKNLDSNFSDEFIQKEIDEIDEFLDDYDEYIYGTDAAGMTCELNGKTTDDVFQGLTPDEYIQLMGPMMQQASAIAKQDGYTLFPSVMLAQSIEESGWGKSAIHNNLFGIKCHGYERCVSTGTTEFIGGSRVPQTADFRIYDSIEESIIDRNNFLIENQRYDAAGVFDAATPEEQAQALQNAKYAGNSTIYASHIISIINGRNLKEWDVNNTFCLSSETEFTPRTVAPTSSDVAYTVIDSANRGQCVWYVRGRTVEVAMELAENGSIDQTTSDFIQNAVKWSKGNGGEWYDKAAGYGYFESSNDINAVEPGAIISWKDPGSYGHVAFIEDVNQEHNTITISEGWTNTGSCPSHWGCISFKTRTISLDEYFNSFGPYYTGGYVFSGYIYTLKPEIS